VTDAEILLEVLDRLGQAVSAVKKAETPDQRYCAVIFLAGVATGVQLFVESEVRRRDYPE